MHFRIMLGKSKIIIIKMRHNCFIYIWSKMLSLSLDSLFKVSTTTSSQKLYAYDYVTLYVHCTIHDAPPDTLAILNVINICIATNFTVCCTQCTMYIFLYLYQTLFNISISYLNSTVKGRRNKNYCRLIDTGRGNGG